MIKIRKVISLISILLLSIIFVACENLESEVKIVKDHSYKQMELKEKEPIIIDDPQDEEETHEPQVIKETKEVNLLDGYSNEKIEYARVWLQVIGNQETNEIKVHHIKAGDPVNSHDETSVNYPEDVIHLSGDFLGSGNIVYSGNGDGTINIYNIPSHWYEEITENQSMEDYTNDLINNTETVYIEPREDEDLIKMIEKLNIKN